MTELCLQNQLSKPDFSNVVQSKGNIIRLLSGRSSTIFSTKYAISMKRKMFTFVTLKLFDQRNKQDKKDKTRQEKYIKQKLNAVGEL
jgi:hypothetical protein